jgi:5'-3' exonuclease
VTPLLAVDGHHLLYRSWHGFSSRRITSRDKARDLTGVFGFLAILRKTHVEEAPGHEIIVVFDGEDAAAHRQACDPAYKAPRASADHTAVQSLTLVKAGLDAAGISWIELGGQEGDDVIATLARTAASTGRAVTCYSGDRDLYQLASDHTTILSPARRRITPAAVRDRFAVTPAQWPDYRALTGDPSDNIPGIPGVGPKTAAALLAGGKRLEHLASPGVSQTPRHRAVSSHYARLLTWRDMIRLDQHLALPAGTLTGAATAAMPRAADILEHLQAW